MLVIICGLLGLAALKVSDAVKITNFKVPSTYTLEDRTNPEPLVLDCEYEIDPNETGFFLKWLLNDNQIYQWIPNIKPSALGHMKTRIDTTFSLSNDKVKHYRAMSIIRPEWNITGEYTCSVSTFQSTDSKSSHLQVIVPETDFRLNARVNTDQNAVEIICSVQDVFPQPALTVMLSDERPLRVSHDIQKGSNGLYDGSVSTFLYRSDIVSPTPINCVLTLPGTNYTKRRETIFYDPGDPTTAEPVEEEISSAISRLEGDIESASNNGLRVPTISLAAIILIMLAVSS